MFAAWPRADNSATRKYKSTLPKHSSSRSYVTSYQLADDTCKKIADKLLLNVISFSLPTTSTSPPRNVHRKLAIMSITMISATPSPYARINRIAMIEKGIPFELKSEIPWHNTTETPKYNPLEKLPVLLFSDGREPIYDSAHIQRWIVAKYANQGPKLITGDMETDFKLEQIQVLAEGVMDAVVLAFFEKAREVKSDSWLARQSRKVEGGFKAFEDLVKSKPKDSEYLFGNQLTIADIAICCATGFVDFNGAIPGWKEKHPNLAAYWSTLDEHDSFKETRPVMFDIKPNVVV